MSWSVLEDPLAEDGAPEALFGGAPAPAPAPYTPEPEPYAAEPEPEPYAAEPEPFAAEPAPEAASHSPFDFDTEPDPDPPVTPTPEPFSDFFDHDEMVVEMVSEGTGGDATASFDQSAMPDDSLEVAAGPGAGQDEDLMPGRPQALEELLARSEPPPVDEDKLDAFERAVLAATAQEAAAAAEAAEAAEQGPDLDSWDVADHLAPPGAEAAAPVPEERSMIDQAFGSLDMVPTVGFEDEAVAVPVASADVLATEDAEVGGHGDLDDLMASFLPEEAPAPVAARPVESWGAPPEPPPAPAFSSALDDMFSPEAQDLEISPAAPALAAPAMAAPGPEAAPVAVREPERDFLAGGEPAVEPASHSAFDAFFQPEPEIEPRPEEAPAPAPWAAPAPPPPPPPPPAEAFEFPAGAFESVAPAAVPMPEAPPVPEAPAEHLDPLAALSALDGATASVPGSAPPPPRGTPELIVEAGSPMRPPPPSPPPEEFVDEYDPFAELEAGEGEGAGTDHPPEPNPVGRDPFFAAMEAGGPAPPPPPPPSPAAGEDLGALARGPSSPRARDEEMATTIHVPSQQRAARETHEGADAEAEGTEAWEADFYQLFADSREESMAFSDAQLLDELRRALDEVRKAAT